MAKHKLTKRLGESLVEHGGPILIVVISLMVLALGIFTPMWDMLDLIQH